MDRELVIDILRQNQANIKTFGVKRLALFGSLARDEAKPSSDVDILVEFERPVGLFSLVALQQHLEDLLNCPVDLVTRDSINKRILPLVLEESVDVT